jgi:hypothetical protein
VRFPLVYLTLLAANFALYASVYPGTEMTGLLLYPLALPWVFPFSGLLVSWLPEGGSRAHEIQRNFLISRHFLVEFVPLGLAYVTNLLICYVVGRLLDTVLRKPGVPPDS